MLPGEGMHPLSSARTDKGRRSNNEDAFLDAKHLGLYAVADGIGGYEGGEVASQLVTTTLAQFVDDHQRDPSGTWPIKERASRRFDENLLVAAIEAAHRSVLAKKQGALSQMGSTVVAALLRKNLLTVAHCGDSRAYRLRGGKVAQLTRDHSLWAEMQAAGLAGERAQFLYKNQITRALGLEGHATCDVQSWQVEEGDVYLLCSDGVYDPFDMQELEPLIRGGVDQVIRHAFERGSTDNMTALVLSLDR